MVKFDNSHRTIDQKVDGAVDGQEQLVDAKSTIIVKLFPRKERL